MQKPKFDDLMAQLSQQAETERAEEAVQRVRLAKRNRILSYIGTGVVLMIFGTAGYFHAEIRAKLIPNGLTTTAGASSNSGIGIATGGTSTVSRAEKLKMTVAAAQSHAALVDNIMDDVPDQEVGKVNVVDTNGMDAAANGRGSLKTAMVNAKNHAALIDSIMDGKNPPTNAVPTKQ